MHINVALMLLSNSISCPTDATISITLMKSHPSPNDTMLCLGDLINYSCEITDLESISLTWRVAYPDNMTILAHRFDISSSLNTVIRLSYGITVLLRYFSMTEMAIEAFLFITIGDENIAILNGPILECRSDFESTYVSITNVVGKYTKKLIEFCYILICSSHWDETTYN